MFLSKALKNAISSKQYRKSIINVRRFYKCTPICFQEADNDYVQNLQCFLEKARRQDKAVETSEEYHQQQDLYSQYAQNYDEMYAKTEYEDALLIYQKAQEWYPENKNISILDYGCGSGRIASSFAFRGYGHIDGSEPNKTFLESAEKTNIFRNLYQVGSFDDHSVIKQKHYDLLISSGCFFISQSHPGYDVFPVLTQLVRKNGYITICTAERYMRFPHVQNDKVEEMERQGKIEILPTMTFPNFRVANEWEKDEDMHGIILNFKVVD